MIQHKEHWTDEQTRAIEARGHSVALAAGAGCGKTFVLTERFLSQLAPESADAAALHELIAITFTDRAAREMRERIRRRCLALIEEANGDEASYWLDVWRNLDAARVSTIHSFCASFLRAHAVEAGVDPRFAVLEQAQSDTLLTEVIDDRLRAALAEQDPTVMDLLLAYGLNGVKQMLRTLVARWRGADWQRWSTTSPEELVELWRGRCHDLSGQLVADSLGQLPATRQLVRLLKEVEPDNDKLRAKRQTMLRLLPALSDGTGPPPDLAELREATLLKPSGDRYWPSAEVYESYKDAVQALRKEIDQVQWLAEFDPAAALPAARAGLELLRFAATVAEAYQAAKERLGRLDFEDLLIRTTRLLRDEANQNLRERTAAQIQMLLVDEFQDTDTTQVELIRALCGEQMHRGKLFFVGDEKQSIYRFRGAQPRVFRQLQDDVPEAGRLPLSQNFRSQPAILHFVNALFCERLGPRYLALRPTRPQSSATPAVEFLWAESDEVRSTAGAPRRARQQEADGIARRLREMLDSGEPIVAENDASSGESESGCPKLRAVRPGDVAILLRALTDVDLYEEALRRYDIDYYLVGGHAFYAQQEIYDLLNLLRAVASYCDEVSLAGVLRSPIFGLTDESLFWLSHHKNGLAVGLMTDPLPKELDDQQRRCVTFAAATLRELRQLKDRIGVAPLINKALRRTGYDAVLLAEFLGERKLANLRKLVDQARAIDRAGFGLGDFIVQLSQSVAEQPREPLAATQPELADIVRIMTIHQAKGLEFSVVVVPDIDRKQTGRTGRVALTEELGPLVPMPAEEKDAKCGLDVYNLMERQEDEREADRLFYVACTRAADYLMLSSSVFPNNWPSGHWARLLNERFDVKSGNLRGELPPGYQRVEVRVTTEPPQVKKATSRRSARGNLQKWHTEIAEITERGEAINVKAVAPLSVRESERRSFSFSRLSGKLYSYTPDGTAGTVGDGIATGIIAEDNFALDDPIASDDATITDLSDARGLGTLVHGVLEDLSFGEKNDVAALVARRAARDRLNDPSQCAVAVDLAERFLDSPLAGRLAKARQVHREVEFMLSWPPDQPVEGGRYLHGYIDCLFQDDAGRWHVIDYKTNRVAADQVERAADPYEMQLLLYGLAVEKVLKEPPTGLILYFLRPGVAHELPWDAASGQRAVDMVDLAMARLVDERAEVRVEGQIG